MRICQINEEPNYNNNNYKEPSPVHIHENIVKRQTLVKWDESIMKRNTVHHLFSCGSKKQKYVIQIITHKQDVRVSKSYDLVVTL